MEFIIPKEDEHKKKTGYNRMNSEIEAVSKTGHGRKGGRQEQQRTSGTVKQMDTQKKNPLRPAAAATSYEKLFST